MFSQNNNEKPIALGLTAKQLVELLDTNKAYDARKALNYLDGQQEEEVIKALNDPHYGRKNWKQRGIVPRFRGVTRMVVEKSGQLFKDGMPMFEIYARGQNAEDVTATQQFAEEMSLIEFPEFMANFDLVLRLLKTACMLVQFDQEGQKIILDTLHRGNAEVITDPLTKKVLCLVYRSHANGYWVWTPDEVIELREIEGAGQVERFDVISRQPNTYGIVPIVPFYDTNLPRDGFWVEQDKSLVNLNEMVNLHITDSEFSNLWMKMSTPVTNMKIAGDGGIENIEYAAMPNSKLPRPVTSDSTELLGGPNQVITMDSMGVDSPFFEYKSPKIDLKQLNEVVDNWIKAYAGDWCVHIRAQNEGRAESGFQLIVEEFDNLDLRKQRQRMYENGFKRFYRVFQQVYNTATNTNTFPADANLFVEFNDPLLPTDSTKEEQVWSMRIKEQRATPIDYYMQVYGMNREEAEIKYAEVKAFFAANDTPDSADESTDVVELEDEPSVNPQMGNQQ